MFPVMTHVPDPTCWPLLVDPLPPPSPPTPSCSYAYALGGLCMEVVLKGPDYKSSTVARTCCFGNGMAHVLIIEL